MPRMSLTLLLSALRAEIAAAEHRAAERATAVTARLRGGEDSAEAERALFGELDRLALLRQRLCALKAMQPASPASLKAA